MDPKWFFLRASGGPSQVPGADALHQLTCGLERNPREQTHGDAKSKFRKQIQSFPFAQQAGVAEHGQNTLHAVIKELAQESARSGITITLEFVNRYESNLLNTVQQTLDYMDDVDEDNVVVHADVYHMNIEERGFRTPLLLAGDRLGYVHIGESNRGYLGQGTIDFEEVFGALADMNYQGPITFESFSSAVVDQHLSNTLAVWRNLWEDSMDLGTHAREFMATGMENARATVGSR